jgi:hypothetical protein
MVSMEIEMCNYDSRFQRRVLQQRGTGASSLETGVGQDCMSSDDIGRVAGGDWKRFADWRAAATVGSKMAAQAAPTFHLELGRK